MWEASRGDEKGGRKEGVWTESAEEERKGSVELRHVRREKGFRKRWKAS